MQTRTIVGSLIGACAFLAINFLVEPAAALQLITASEAALPSEPNIGRERGITRGPTITIISPSPAAGTIKSPLNLRIKFEGHGGAKINVNSVLLTYLKRPAVDLTQRVEPFISPDGIDVEGADVPPGIHMLRVNVTDSDGRSAFVDFTFTVTK
jgi:hypothetical protein